MNKSINASNELETAYFHGSGYGFSVISVAGSGIECADPALMFKNEDDSGVNPTHSTKRAIQ